MREAFVGLLQELHSKGLIKARTKWMDTRPIFEKISDTLTFVANLGRLHWSFWDLVEEERRKLKLQREQVIDVLTAKKFAIDDGTKFEEFAKFVQTTMATTHSISEENLETILKISRQLRRKNARKTVMQMSGGLFVHRMISGLCLKNWTTHLLELMISGKMFVLV